MPNKNIGLYRSKSLQTLQRGELKDVSDLEKNLSPAIDLNYRRLLPERKEAKILDIGCGWGYLLYYLKRKGYSDIKGVDLKDQVERIDFIKRNITEKVEGVDSLEDYLVLHNGEYDLILLKQVIYYFKREDLLPMMRHVKEALKPGGTLVVEVFNGSLLTSAFIQNVDYQRKLIFTEYSLANLLQNAGFELEDLFGMVHPLRKNLRSIICFFIQKLWVLLLNLIYILERGIDPVRRPHIFSKHIIAVAKNRQ